MKGVNFVQAQAYEGYWENERFYPYGKPIQKTGRQRAILTFISEHHSLPVSENAVEHTIVVDELPEGFDNLVKIAGVEEAYRRVAWLKRLEEAREYAEDAPLLEIQQRAKDMRPPVLFEE